MKKLTERTEILIGNLMSCDFRTEVGIDKARELIRRALKEQDKITRHACADEVEELQGCGFDAWNGEKIFKSEAQQAIINTKAI